MTAKQSEGRQPDRSFSVEELLFSQAELQRDLSTLHKYAGLDVVLRELFSLSRERGYFPEGVFSCNDIYSFEDPECAITFRTQVNRTRLTYRSPLKKVKAAAACPICFENIASDAKPLLRAFEFALGQDHAPFFAQLTPFPLREGHYIVILKDHSPMRVTRQSMDEMLDFVKRAPGFVACSNSDVIDAGVSILDHHHYQMFDELHLPVFEATVSDGMSAKRKDASLELLKYPMTALRVRGGRKGVLEAASAVVDRWKALEPGRNTCNLAARRIAKGFELYLFFRNPAHRTPPDLLRIKSEGVGVVEACGEGIYPPPADEATMEEIRMHGLTVLKRILAGLDPIKPEGRAKFFETVCVAE